MPKQEAEKPTPASEIVEPIRDAPMPRRQEPQRRDVRADEGAKLPRLPSRPERVEPPDAD